MTPRNQWVLGLKMAKALIEEVYVYSDDFQEVVRDAIHTSLDAAIDGLEEAE